MNYRFTNLLGAPYRGGTLALAGDTLFSPVGNRVGTVSWKGRLGASAFLFPPRLSLFPAPGEILDH